MAVVAAQQNDRAFPQCFVAAHAVEQRRELLVQRLERAEVSRPLAPIAVDGRAVPKFMDDSIGVTRLDLVRRGQRLEYFTVAYNSLEGLVSVIAGLIAG